MHTHYVHYCFGLQARLPGKAGGTFRWALISNLGFGVRQGDDVVVVPLVGLHGSVENGAGVQRRSEPTEARQAGLGPKDGWVVAPQKLLIHLLILLLRGQEESETREGQTRNDFRDHLTGRPEPAPPHYVNKVPGAQRGKRIAQSH